MRWSFSILHFIGALGAVSVSVAAWSSTSTLHQVSSFSTRRLPSGISAFRVQRLPVLHSKQVHDDDNVKQRIVGAQKIAASMALATLLWTTPLGPLSTSPTRAAFAYDSSDYASATVQEAVVSVQKAVGDTTALVQAFESIAAIITEGKGIGGEINFKGVQLDRGFVSDEDTAIYNPGLTLLTESEKDRLVDAIVQSKKASLSMSSSNARQMTAWNADTEAGYAYLRTSLDPLHTYELRGYLQFVPYYGAALYLVALAAQQWARDVFPAVYITCALAVFAPIVVLVLLGPQ